MCGFCVRSFILCSCRRCIPTTAKFPSLNHQPAATTTCSCRETLSEAPRTMSVCNHCEGMDLIARLLHALVSGTQGACVLRRPWAQVEELVQRLGSKR